MNTIEDILRDKFIEIIDRMDFDSLLAECLKTIRKKCSPEQVFDEIDLLNWAQANGLIKPEDK